MHNHSQNKHEYTKKGRFLHGKYILVYFLPFLYIFGYFMPFELFVKQWFYE